MFVDSGNAQIRPAKIDANRKVGHRRSTQPITCKFQLSFLMGMTKPALLLAAWTIMAATPRYDDALDRSLAHQARFALAPIHSVFQLKEPFFAIGIDVVGNAGAAKPDRFF